MNIKTKQLLEDLQIAVSSEDQTSLVGPGNSTECLGFYQFPEIPLDMSSNLKISQASDLITVLALVVLYLCLYLYIYCCVFCMFLVSLQNLGTSLTVQTLEVTKNTIKAQLTQVSWLDVLSLYDSYRKHVDGAKLHLQRKQMQVLSAQNTKNMYFEQYRRQSVLLFACLKWGDHPPLEVHHVQMIARLHTGLFAKYLE